MGQPEGIEQFKAHPDGSIFDIKNNCMIKGSYNGPGYLGVTRGGKYYFFHRIVAAQLVPNPYNKPFVNHINGVKTDNRSANLEWVTHQENCLHAFRIGLQKQKTGVASEHSKLKLWQVKAIRLFAGRFNYPKSTLARAFNTTTSNVCKILKGTRWPMA